MKRIIKGILFCMFIMIGQCVFAQEKTINYFIGFQPSYINESTGKTFNSQFSNYTNYTNKGGYSYGVNLQNGISIKKWIAILNIGLHQKSITQTYSFYDGLYPIAFGEINYKIPYFNSEFFIGRKIKISEQNRLQVTIGYGIEKNLKSDFSGDFNNPNDAIEYFQYKSTIGNNISKYFSAQVGLSIPFSNNELIIGVLLKTVMEEFLLVQIKNSSNVMMYGNSVNYLRKSFGIFLTYRFL